MHHSPLFLLFGILFGRLSISTSFNRVDDCLTLEEKLATGCDRKIDYQGCSVSYPDRDHTVSGTPCQRWADNDPHEHKFAQYVDPETRKTNYCRNPSQAAGGPWCYTTNATKRWEYCFETYCLPVEEKSASVCNRTFDYDGCSVSYPDTGTTLSRRTCQRWADNSPWEHTFAQYVDPETRKTNYCRNPSTSAEGPWCYTTDTKKRWETCFPTCKAARIDCKLSEWSDFWSCSELCGEGTHTRRREVLVEPANCGAACGALTDVQSCKQQECNYPETITRALCTIEADCDYPGNDINVTGAVKATYGVTSDIMNITSITAEDECAQACQNRPACVSFTFRDNACYLKSAVGTRTAVSGASCGVCKKTGCVTKKDCSFLKTMDGNTAVQFRDTIYKLTSFWDVEACASKCARTQSCMQFQFKLMCNIYRAVIHKTSVDSYYVNNINSHVALGCANCTEGCPHDFEKNCLYNSGNYSHIMLNSKMVYSASECLGLCNSTPGCKAYNMHITTHFTRFNGKVIKGGVGYCGWCV